jgi:hypothetical protein
MLAFSVPAMHPLLLSLRRNDKAKPEFTLEP